MPMLGIFEQAVVGEGRSGSEAIRNCVELAVVAEELGYHRFWLAEHHLSPGIAASSPLPLAAAASRTSRIRLGTAVSQLAFRSPLMIAEEAATLDAFAPGRIDIGIGRPRVRVGPDHLKRHSFESPAKALRAQSLSRLVSPRYSSRPGSFEEDVEELCHLLSGNCWVDGYKVDVTPRRDCDVELWLMAAGPGATSRLAGDIGLPLCVGFHHSPASAGDALNSYRERLRSDGIERTAATVFVHIADSDRETEEIRAAYRFWMRGTLLGGGTPPFPTVETVARNPVTDWDAEVTSPFVEAMIIGVVDQVVGKLRILCDTFGLDELMVFSPVTNWERRQSTYQRLADAWH